MAQNVEPMDVDSEFDNKENTYHHSNVLPCTEKGYEELDVSELNMKLRYSVTPHASPMSKSYTTHVDKTFDIDTLNGNEANLTRSLNSNINKSDVIKSLKSLPLQALPSGQFTDGSGNPTITRQLDHDSADINVMVTGPNDIDEKLSLPSSSSSEIQTPATTPTKDIKNDGSPIMRGLKSVLNMFRASQSPIPPSEENLKQTSTTEIPQSQAVASTPIAAHRNKEGNTRKSSPLKDSISFNDDLEKELNWKDETTIIFSHEKIPIHKLLLLPSNKTKEYVQENVQSANVKDNLNATVEFMDVSYNDPVGSDNVKLDLNVETNNVLNTVNADITEGSVNVLNATETISYKDCNITQPVQSTENIILDKSVLQNENILTISTYTDKENIYNTTTENVNLEKETPQFVQTINNIKDDEDSANATAPIEALENIVSEKEISQNNSQTENVLNITKEVPETECTANATAPLETTENIILEKETQIVQTENILNITKDISDKEGTTDASVLNKYTENLVLPQETLQENIITENVVNITKDVEAEGNTNIESNESKENIIVNQDTLGENLQTENNLNISKDDTILESNANLTLTYNINDVYNIPEKEDKINEGNASHCDVPLNTPVKNIIDVTSIDPLTTKVSDENERISSVNNNIDPKADVKNMCVSSEPTIVVDKMLENSCTINEKCIDELKIPPDEPSDLPLSNANICVLSSSTADSNVCNKEIEVISKAEESTGLTYLNYGICKDITAQHVGDSNEKQDEVIDNSEKEKPADVPLPDDDDDGKDILEIPVNALSVLPSVTHDVSLIQTQTTCEMLNSTITDFAPPAVDSQNLEQKVEYAETMGVENVPEENTDGTEVASVQTDNVSKVSEVALDSLEHNKELPEIVSECKTTDLETCDLNQSKVINTCEILDVTMNKDNSALVVNDNEHVDVMDTTLNKSLKPKDLPDLVNQTITLPEEIEKNAVSELPIVPPEIPKEIDNLETSLKECTEIKASNEAIEQNNSSQKLQKTEETDIKTLEIEKDQIVNTTAGTHDEEIIISENNSPYVSLMAGLDKISDKAEQTLEEVENPINTTMTVPSSPPIKSRGYNFNFDDMDDPFNTKNKIRLSPGGDTSKFNEPEDEDKKIEIPKKVPPNRRKSQPVDRKKPLTIKKKLNATFSAPLSSKMSINEDEIEVKTVKEKLSVADYIWETSQVTQKVDVSNSILTKHDEIVPSDSNVEVEDLEKEFDNEENKTSIDSITSVSNDGKISSLEQSTYYSAGTSSIDSAKTKNVFNLPEIEDINFNPFTTKPKIRQSPQREMAIENPFSTRTKILNSSDSSMIAPPNDDQKNKENLSEGQSLRQVNKMDTADKMETELMEKDTSANTSSTTAPINQSTTVRETNTEDEDTEEGPFLDAEDIIDKMSDFDDGNVDMMQFNELPAQGLHDNGGELFIDAEAYEFLLNQNQCNMVAESGKESLFLKFDPLFANKISSDGVLAALDKVQRKQSTPTKPARPSLKNEASPIAGPSTLNTTYECDNNVSQETNDDLNVTVAKPMMVVTPAVNPAVTPRNKSITPTRSNRRSITFTSPAIAVIDRLLSMSSNNSFVGQDATILQSPRREQNEADLALTQLRELLAEKEISVYNLRYENKELQDRLSTMESQIRILEADGQDRLKKINELNEHLTEKTKINKSMAAVVEEYERTIASLIAETEQDKKRNAEERMRLINERDEQTAHLASMEVSFSDLHSKYEKSKQVILACKANEDAYRKSIKDFEENLNKAQSNYELLKQHATSKLNHANQELEKMNRSHEVEVVKLNALIKRKELHVKSLEETLAQKTKDNDELTAICDELINKV